MGRSGERGVAPDGVRVSRVEDHPRPDVTGWKGAARTPDLLRERCGDTPTVRSC